MRVASWESSRWWRLRSSKSLAVLVTAALIIPLAPQVAMAKAVAAPTPTLAPSVSGVTPVAGHPSAKPKVPAQYAATKVRWPAAKSGTMSLVRTADAASPSAEGSASASPQASAGATSSQSPGSLVSAGRVGVAGTPVWASLPAGKPVSQGPSSVSVSVAPHQAAASAGVDGVLFSVSAAKGSGTTQVGLDYGAFAQAYGGSYGARLTLVQMPACALTTPSVAACRKQTPVRSANDPVAQTVSAQVTLKSGSVGSSATSSSSSFSHGIVGAASAQLDSTATASGTGGAAMVLAATASPSGGDGGGAAGQYGATSLQPSGTWSAGGSDGSFTYSYPVTVPPAASALTPQVALGYSSAGVDGQTSASDAQADWLGDGWSTPENFIEQSFVSCSDDPEGTASPNATKDLCYDGPILTLSLNGSSIELVCNQAETSCTPSDADGDVVTHHTGSSNGSGTYNTDYWTVTDTAGTVYSFGLNKLPGFAGTDATTNSVASEPVFSAHNPKDTSGSYSDPCYNATWSSSVCTMAYRWSLDYVKDVYGNAMAYYYTQATNAYAENGNTSGSAVSYIRDTYLKRIDYGFRDGGAYGTVPDQIVFTPGDRCTAGTSACDPLSSSTAANWPDVPYDLNCAAGSACAVTSPSNWSTVSLASITTQQWNGTTYLPVDTYAFKQTIPSVTDGTAPTLFLSSITHTGNDTSAGGSAAALPAVTFTPVMLANRADLKDGLPALDRYRIGSITTETGSVIGVSYELTNPCSSPVTVTPSSNTTSCYPVYWTPSGGSQILDWFNKYAVASISQSDPYGGSAGLYTTYKYMDAPAWHYDDNEMVQPKYRTYGQFRGYGDVQTLTGTGSDAKTQSETWYYRGMSDDNNSTAVTLTDSQNGTHDDTNALAGQTLETAQYAYAGTGAPVVSSTIDSYWISPTIATRIRTGLPALVAQRVEPDESWTRTAITDLSPASWRETAQLTTYDANTADASFGLPTFAYSTGDLSLIGTAQSQETCTETTYVAPNTSLNLVGLTAETRTLDKACGGSSAIGSSTPTAPTGGQVNGLTAPSSVDLSTDVIADTRTFYNNPTMAGTWPQPTAPTWPQAAPATPQPSVSQAANGYNSSTGQLAYVTKSASLYDTYNRPSATYDAMGDETQYAYTMSAYGTVTATKTTNPLGQFQTSTMDPERSLVLTATDYNAVTSTIHYDGLGRVIAVWRYGRATSVAANDLYTYSIVNNAAPSVTSQSLNEESGYSTSVQIYDSLLRARQTQSQAVSTTAGRLIDDTFYDTHGWVVKSNSSYYDSSSNPSTTLVSVADNQVTDQTVTSYDGLGRTVETQNLNNTATPVVDHIGYSEYTGDKTISVPPSGGVAEATITDALGNTTELDQYKTAPTVTTGTTGGFTTVSVTGGTTSATTYGFDAHGLPSTTTDANGDVSTTRYDFLGQAITSIDPDAGTSTTAYDAQGRVSQTTDNAGNVISYKYDALGRKLAEYNGAATAQHDYGTTGANEVASWVYDNSNTVSGVTDPVGQMTTQSTYTSAGVFKVQAVGFNAFGESLGETYTVPGTTSIAGTYTYKHSYTPVTGLPKQNLIPAVGAMAQEITTTGYSIYDSQDEPTSLNGLNGYAHNVNYTQWGQIAEVEYGTTTSNGYADFTYDQLTGALNNESVKNTAVSATPMDQTSYSYDASGNPTSIAETRSGTATETQCYTYDPLDRLTNAWTATGSCSTTPTQANETTTVGDQISGGAYWTSWTFDDIGQVKTQTQHSTTGGTDTVATYGYGTNNTSQCSGLSGGGANTLKTISTTGPSGSTSANYCSNTTGQITSMPGSTSSSGQNSLTWNPEGALDTDTTAAGTSQYIYNGSGSLVERTDPGTVTVYLPGQQLVYDTNNKTTNITRFITLPGGGQLVESGTTGNYRFELANPQGTSTISLDATLQNPTYQEYTPYGAPRGTTPTTWTDPNGYLGKVQDATDGLVTMGTREYDPSIGRFVSLDPVLEASDPQELNGYTYAGANPITSSDPSGQCPVDKCGTGVPKPTIPPPSSPPPPPTTNNCAGLHGKQAALCSDGAATADDICDAACLQLQDASLQCGKQGGVYDNGTCTIAPPPQPHHWWQVALAVVAIVVIVAVAVALVAMPVLALPVLMDAGAAFTEAAMGTSVGAGLFAGSMAAGASVATAVGADTVAVGLGLAATAAGATYEVGSGLGGDGEVGRSPHLDPKSQTRVGASFTTPKIPSMQAIVNPTGGNRNCVACAIATDMSYDGVMASAMPGGAYSVTNIENYAGVEMGRGRSATGIINELQDAGPGARGIVVGSTGAAGHAFNVINNDGVIQFIDNQSSGGGNNPLIWNTLQLARTK